MAWAIPLIGRSCTEDLAYTVAKMGKDCKLYTEVPSPERHSPI